MSIFFNINLLLKIFIILIIVFFKMDDLSSDEILVEVGPVQVLADDDLHSNFNLNPLTINRELHNSTETHRNIYSMLENQLRQWRELQNFMKKGNQFELNQEFFIVFVEVAIQQIDLMLYNQRNIRKVQKIQQNEILKMNMTLNQRTADFPFLRQQLKKNSRAISVHDKEIKLLKSKCIKLKKDVDSIAKSNKGNDSLIPPFSIPTDGCKSIMDYSKINIDKNSASFRHFRDANEKHSSLSDTDYVEVIPKPINHEATSPSPSMTRSNSMNSDDSNETLINGTLSKTRETSSSSFIDSGKIGSTQTNGTGIDTSSSSSLSTPSYPSSNSNETVSTLTNSIDEIPSCPSMSSRSSACPPHPPSTNSKLPTCSSPSVSRICNIIEKIDQSVMYKKQYNHVLDKMSKIKITERNNKKTTTSNKLSNIINFNYINIYISAIDEYKELLKIIILLIDFNWFITFICYFN